MQLQSKLLKYLFCLERECKSLVLKNYVKHFSFSSTNLVPVSQNFLAMAYQGSYQWKNNNISTRQLCQLSHPLPQNLKSKLYSFCYQNKQQTQTFLPYYVINPPKTITRQ